MKPWTNEEHPTMVPSQNHTTIMLLSRGNGGTGRICSSIGEVHYGNAGNELFDINNPGPARGGPAALCLRGGWSMGQVRDGYWFTGNIPKEEMELRAAVVACAV